MDGSMNLNASNRKIRKPLMERKRRARINKSLNELHQLLTETDFTSRGTKLEKADILEMTVQLLKNMKINEYSKENKENLENLMTEQYLLGFEKCIKEIGALVAEIPGLDLNQRQNINSHLESRFEKFKRQSKSCTDAFEPMSVRKRENERVDAFPWESTKTCSVLLQGPKEFKILPSKLPNGDVILLVSSNLKEEEGLSKSHMWRPWW